MDRERSSLYLGLGLLTAGVVVLAFVLVSALGLAANPGPFMGRQVQAASSGTPPVAFFTWTSNDLTVTFTDISIGRGAPIASRTWDLGDGTQSSEPGPSHPYPGNGTYMVLLRVRDEAGLEAIAGAQVNVQQGANNQGASETSQGQEFDLGRVLIPVGIATLTFGLYGVSFLVGGSLVKAGWNLIRPRPETIRIRLKPQQFETFATAEVVRPAPPPVQAMAPEPPPPSVPAPPPPES